MNRAYFVPFAAAALALGCSSDETAPSRAKPDASRGRPDAAQPSDAAPPRPDGSMEPSGDGAVRLTSIVETKNGRVQGDIAGGARRFRGIPYAKAPVGDLRWAPPQPIPASSDLLQALDFKSECAQPSWIQGPESDNEDCLYLNVWTPDKATKGPLPVMVWMPGGGNQNGGASDNSPLTGGKLIYDGAPLASAHDVVVVTINYRLGVFGFFSHPGLTKEGSNSGNQGLLDQQAALGWVRDNIAAFGGDPKNVTLFGESAGSQDTCLQVVSPGSAGLFQRAISESGGCTTFRKTKAQAELQIRAFSSRVGCSGATDELACLRKKPVKDFFVTAPAGSLVDGGAVSDGGALPGGAQFSGTVPAWDFNPVVDGTVIPDQPRALVEAEKFAKVPYILGSNFEEGRLFLLAATPVTTDSEYEAALERLFGSASTTVAATYPTSSFQSPQDALVRVWGDFRLGCPTYESAQRFAEHGSPVYIYHYAHPIPGLEAIGPTHGTEMPYVFGTLPNPATADQKLSDAVQGYWTRFARSGDPNGASALTWPAFDSMTDQSIILDVSLSVQSGYRRKECDMWAKIYDAAFE